MPWKVKKIRRFGPFWLETSRDRAEWADLSSGRAHPGHRKLFGHEHRRPTPAPSADGPLFGEGRREPTPVVPLEAPRPLRVVPDPDLVDLTARPDPTTDPHRASWGA